MTSTQQISSAVRVIASIGGAIRDLKEVPSGHLYAQLSNLLTLEQFNACLRVLEEQQLITLDGGSHLIKWTGPEF